MADLSQHALQQLNLDPSLIRMTDPFKPAPSVASRFVSQTELSEAQAKREADVRAAYARLGQEPPAEALAAARGGAAEYDPRSLYERLQANKNAKQEKFDDMMKLSNQFRGLDEGETEFLAEVAAEKRAEETRRREEEEQELLEFRRATFERAASPPDPLTLLTGSALSTSPPVASKAASSLTPSTSASAARKPPAPSAGTKRSAEEAAAVAAPPEAKKVKDTSGLKPAGAAGGSAPSSAASRKKKAAAALGIVRKKPAQ
ncbi:hypothetical protein OC861_002328 [Tilletia horrida]|nr:hypothetical protein OC861_002328 [Tilletia horrida]